MVQLGQDLAVEVAEGVSPEEPELVPPQVGVQPPQLGVQGGGVLADGLDVVAELGEEVPGQLVEGELVVLLAAEGEGGERELGLDVVDDLLDGVDGLIAVDEGGEVAEAVFLELLGEAGLGYGGNLEFEGTCKELKKKSMFQVLFVT